MTFVNTAQNETVDISFSIFTFSSRSAGLKANLMADNQRKFQRGAQRGKGTREMAVLTDLSVKTMKTCSSIRITLRTAFSNVEIKTFQHHLNAHTESQSQIRIQRPLFVVEILQKTLHFLGKNHHFLIVWLYLVTFGNARLVAACGSS